MPAATYLSYLGTVPRQESSDGTDTDAAMGSDDGERRYWRALADLTQTVNGLSSALTKLTRLQQSASDGTGWGLLEKTVRGYDEDKIKASTDKIDTLLIFSGLYAAILTAFTVLSLTYLDPEDTGKETVMLLRQLVDQGSGPSSGLGRRADDALIDTGMPPAWAVRVNVVWFASLVMSLAAASLGILVRQWLAESLTRTYKSPQQLLRARQFREAALTAWKVPDIADALPMILELAVLFFFIGLCEFTANVNKSVSSVYQTTLVLVIGWGSILSASFIFPCFFANCPYKSNFFYHIASSVRRQFFTSKTKTYRPNQGLEANAGRGKAAATLKRMTPDVVKQDWGLEEEDAVEWQGLNADVKLFVSLDSIIPDAGLLETILEVYEQIGHHSLEETLRFSLMLLSHRIQIDFDEIVHDTSPLPTTQLSPSDWQQLTLLTTRALERGTFPGQNQASLGDQSPLSPEPASKPAVNKEEHDLWLAAIRFLVSPTRHELSRSSAGRLRRCLVRDNCLIFKRTLAVLAESEDLRLKDVIELALRLIRVSLGVDEPAPRLERLLPLGLLDYESGVQVTSVIMQALRKEFKSRTSLFDVGGDARDADLIADAMIILLSASPRALSQLDKDFWRSLRGIPAKHLSRVLSVLDGALPPSIHVGERTVLAVQSLLSLYLSHIPIDADGVPTALDLSDVPEDVQKLLGERLSGTMEDKIKYIRATTVVIPNWIKAGLSLLVSISHKLLDKQQRNIVVGAIRSRTCLMHLLDRSIMTPSGHGFGDVVLSAVRLMNHIGHDLLQTGGRRHLWQIPSPKDHGIAPSTYGNLIEWIGEHWEDWRAENDISMTVESSWWAFDAVMFLLSNEPSADLPPSATQLLLDFARNESCLAACFDMIQYHPGESFVPHPTTSGAPDRRSWTQTIWAASRFIKAIRSTSWEDRACWKPAWDIISSRIFNILPHYDPPWAPVHGTWAKSRQYAICLLLSPLGINLPPATKDLLVRFRSDPGAQLVALSALQHFRTCHGQPSDLVWLSLTITQYILGRVIVKGALDKFLDFTTVEGNLQRRLAELVATALIEPRDSRFWAQNEVPSWVIDAVIFLLSIEDGRAQATAADSHRQLPETGVRALHECFSSPAIAIATGRRLNRTSFVPLAPKLVRACTSGIALKHALALYAPHLCSEQHRHRSLSDALYCSPAAPDTSQRKRVTDDMRDLLSGVARSIHLPSRSWPDVSSEVIATLGQLSTHKESAITISIYTDMWQDPASLGLFWFFAGLHPYDRLDEDSEAGRLCKEVLSQSDSAAVRKCLVQSRRRLEELLRIREDPLEHQDLLRTLGPLNLVRLTRLYLQAFRLPLLGQTPESPLPCHEDQYWTPVWDVLASSVARYWENRDWELPSRHSVDTAVDVSQRASSWSAVQDLLREDQVMAEDCIDWIDELTGNGKGKGFPQELRHALALFVQG